MAIAWFFGFIGSLAAWANVVSLKAEIAWAIMAFICLVITTLCDD